MKKNFFFLGFCHKLKRNIIFKEFFMSMSFTQTKDIIRRCRHDHLEMSEAMEDLEDVFIRPHTASLSHFCAGQQRHMANYIKCFLDSSPREVLNYWFQSVPDMGNPITLLDKVNEDLKSSDFENLVHDISKVFESRYQSFTKLAELSKTRELFTQLSSINHHASEQFHWTVMENRDL
jgi:hypothetical protein